MEIDNLIKNNIDFSKIGQLLNITPENRSNFWKDLIQLMRSFNKPQNNSTLQDLANENANSILGFINKYCDLKDMDKEEREILVSEIFNSLINVYYGTDTNGDFWNESVQSAINYLLKNFYASENEDSQLIAGVDFTRRHIKNANAGLSFKNTPWVEPNFNVNKKTYDSVRGHDQVKDILASKNKMQFTHTQNQNDIDEKGAYNSDLINVNGYAQVSESNANQQALNKWIRLLMPQYGRKVEIEDLDRNFWIIAQAIAAISGFLFDDNSPIPQMFKKLLDEILQLWENIMYLWAKAAILSQKNNTNIRTIVLPVLNSEIYNFKKFDGFDNKTSLELNNNFEISGCLNSNEILNRIKFLKDKYSNDNLVVIPFERLLNYKHNYYGCEYYHYIYTYHRGTDQWTTYNLVWNMDVIKINGIPIPLAPIRQGGNNDFFDNTFYDFANKIYGIREEEDGYSWISPLSIKESLSLDSSKRFYGNLRVTPAISATLNIDSIQIDTINLLITDAASDIITGNNNKSIGAFNFTNKDDNNNNLNFSYVSISNTLSNGNGTIDFSSLENKKTLYMGETISYYNDVQKTLSVGTYEIAGYNQIESPDSYSGGSNNKWSSAEEIENYNWSNGTSVKVKEISEEFIKGRTTYDFAAVKLIFPMNGGQGGNISTDQDYDNYYYYLNSNGNLTSKIRQNNSWQIYNGMMSKGLYIKSDSLNLTKFFTDYIVNRPSQGYGFISGLYLFKKSGETITSDNWAIVSIDATTNSSDNSNYGLLTNYIYIGYGDGITNSEEYRNTEIDFSTIENTNIKQYEFVNGRGNIDSHVFTDIIKNLI